MPEPIIDDISALPQIECGVDYLTHEGLLGADEVKDAAGNMFAAERFQVGNYTRVFVRKYAPDGVTLLGQWAVKGPRGYKIDGFGLAPAGPHLDIRIVAHDTPPDPVNRLSASGRARIANVFVPFDNQVPKAGAENAAPTIQEGEPVDYDRIERMINAAIDDLAGRFGDGGPRQAIMDKAGDALLYMSDPENYGREWKTGRFQDVTYKRDLDRQYIALNKHIIGENTDLEVENQGYIDLIKQCVREVLDERGTQA